MVEVLLYMNLHGQETERRRYSELEKLLVCFGNDLLVMMCARKVTRKYDAEIFEVQWGRKENFIGGQLKMIHKTKSIFNQLK